MDARLDEHFRWIVNRLSTSAPRGVRGAARRARERHIEELTRYRRRGVFPQNRRFPGELVPHFIDDMGVRCAMAHLMERDAKDLVHFIARERNFARIRDLAALPELVLWLERNGLTANEAALVQPSYPTSPADACVCRSVEPTLLEGTVTADPASMTVTTEYGAPSQVKPGDIVQLYSPVFTLSEGQVVIARHYDGGIDLVIAPLENGMLKLGGELCLAGEAHVTAPTDLPLEVFLDASAATSFEECVSILTAYSSEWDPNDPTTTTTGAGGATSAGAGGAGDASTDPTTVVGSGCTCSLPAEPSIDLGAWALSLTLVAGLSALAMRRIRVIR